MTSRGPIKVHAVVSQGPSRRQHCTFVVFDYEAHLCAIMVIEGVRQRYPQRLVLARSLGRLLQRYRLWEGIKPYLSILRAGWYTLIMRG